MQRLAALLTLLLVVSVLPSCMTDSSFARFTDPTPVVKLPDAPTITVDWSKSNKQALMLIGNRTLVFVNGKKDGNYVLLLKQDGTGGHGVMWPSSIHWPGGHAPTLISEPNGEDYLFFSSDGKDYSGERAGQRMQ